MWHREVIYVDAIALLGLKVVAAFHGDMIIQDEVKGSTEMSDPDVVPVQ